jgi:serine-type D-Ala-D-Ala carboxypeptidase (penicillin-binding protein 5/6)
MFIYLCALLAFFLPAVVQAKTKLSSVSISAKRAILMNADTGTILYEKNAYEKCYPGSITKIATAIYFLEKKGDALSEIATANRDDLHIVAPEIRRAPGAHPSYRLEPRGTHMSLRVGERLSLEALFHGLMLCSGNDAANVIARTISGSIPKFMEELNDFLKAKGIEDTYFSNPHGLHFNDHMTTAYDMAKIAKIALGYPFFRKVVSTIEFPRPETNLQKPAVLKQSNRLVKPGKFHYPKAIGIKTGHTAAAGFTIVAAAEDEGRTLIAVILSAPTSEERFQDAITLFNAAFAEKKEKRQLFNKAFDFFELAIPEAKNSLVAEFDHDVSIEYYPAEEPSLQSVVQWRDVKLPIREGAIVAELLLINDQGERIDAFPLFAKNRVEKKPFYESVEFLKELYVHQAVKVALNCTLLALAICFIYKLRKAYRAKR